MDIMDEIRLRAYAKVNLGLDVLRRREDGYHDVRMIMQNINLFDKLTIKKNSKRWVRKRILPRRTAASAKKAL